jgi:hypothetical protein
MKFPIVHIFSPSCCFIPHVRGNLQRKKSRCHFEWQEDYSPFSLLHLSSHDKFVSWDRCPRIELMRAFVHSNSNRIALSVIRLPLLTEQVSSFGNAPHFVRDIYCVRMLLFPFRCTYLSSHLWRLKLIAVTDLQGVPRKVYSYSVRHKSPPLSHISRDIRVQFLSA